MCFVPMNLYNELFNGVRQLRWQHLSPVVSTFSTSFCQAFILLFHLDTFTNPVNSSTEHFHTDAVVPSSDHCRTDTVLPSLRDHYGTTTVASSGDYCVGV